MTTTEFREVFPKIITGTHGPEEGAGAGHPVARRRPPRPGRHLVPAARRPVAGEADGVLHRHAVGCHGGVRHRAHGRVLDGRPGPARGLSPAGRASAAWAPACCSGRATCCPARRSPPVAAPALSRPRGAGRRRRVAGPGSRADDVPPRLPGEEGARARWAASSVLRRCGRWRRSGLGPATRSTTPSGTRAPGS